MKSLFLREEPMHAKDLNLTVTKRSSQLEDQKTKRSDKDEAKINLTKNLRRLTQLTPTDLDDKF